MADFVPDSDDDDVNDAEKGQRHDDPTSNAHDGMPAGHHQLVDAAPQDADDDDDASHARPARPHNAARRSHKRSASVPSHPSATPASHLANLLSATTPSGRAAGTPMTPAMAPTPSPLPHPSSSQHPATAAAQQRLLHTASTGHRGTPGGGGGRSLLYGSTPAQANKRPRTKFGIRASSAPVATPLPTPTRGRAAAAPAATAGAATPSAASAASGPLPHSVALQRLVAGPTPQPQFSNPCPRADATTGPPPATPPPGGATAAAPTPPPRTPLDRLFSFRGAATPAAPPGASPLANPASDPLPGPPARNPPPTPPDPLELLSHQKALQQQLLQSLPAAAPDSTQYYSSQQPGGRRRGAGAGSSLAARLQRALAGLSTKSAAPTQGAPLEMVAEVESLQYEGQLVKCLAACPTVTGGRACLIMQNRSANAAGVGIGSMVRVVAPWFQVPLPQDTLPVILAYTVEPAS